MQLLLCSRKYSTRLLVFSLKLSLKNTLKTAYSLPLSSDAKLIARPFCNVAYNRTKVMVSKNLHSYCRSVLEVTGARKILQNAVNAKILELN